MAAVHTLIDRGELPSRRQALFGMAAVLPSAGAAPATSFATLIETRAPQIMSEGRIPGAAIGLIERGHVTLAKGFGRADHAGTQPVSAETLFGVASISKTFAAWTCMRLVEAGRLPLDAPLIELTPRWPLPRSPYDMRGITARRLLSHTAGVSLGGYRLWEAGSPLPTILESLNGRTNGAGRVRLVRPPGQSYEYSSGGYTLLQWAVEALTGEPFGDLARRTVLAPLGLKDSTFATDPATVRRAAQVHDDEGRPAPQRVGPEQASGGLRTDCSDLLHFACVHFPSVGVPGRGVLAPATLAQMVEPTPESLSAGGGYGLGYMVRKTKRGVTVIGHDGSSQGGYKARMFMAPATADAIVVLTNSRTGDAFDPLIEAWREQLSA